jgi:hypothetical protein
LGTLPISIITMVLPHFPIPWLHSTITIHGRTFLQESLLLAALGTLVQIGIWFGLSTRQSHSNIVVGGLGSGCAWLLLSTTASYGYAWIQTWGMARRPMPLKHQRS